jgi:hypothetical protein
MYNYTIDELLNIIELLKQSLSFYSNENNYIGNSNNIINDNGNQARIILSQVNNLLIIKQKFQEELEEYLKNNKIDDDINEFLKTI